MATHKSAEKRARQAEKRRERNRKVKSQVRTLVKSFQAQIDREDLAASQGRLREAERALRKAASKGMIPRRRASRSVSRLAKQLGRVSRPT